MPLLSIFSCTSHVYACTIEKLMGRGREIAKTIYKRWYREGHLVTDDPSFRNAQALVQEIVALTDFTLPSLSPLQSEEETHKLALHLEDGKKVEMVLLPRGNEKTLCLSSQVGCRQGCLFCQTAKMGFSRNLSAQEMVAGLFMVRHHLKVRCRNLVFMGMGEPFDNYDEVMKAIDIMTDPLSFGIASRRITISTSGKVDLIHRFMDEGRSVNLAISLNAANDLLRKELMPGASRFNLKTLRCAMENYTAKGRTLLMGYILIRGKNDSLSHAKELADYLSDLSVTINLIPYNVIHSQEWTSPSMDSILAFEKYLRDLGYRVFLRNTRGQKIMAACGQLGNPKTEKDLDRAESH